MLTNAYTELEELYTELRYNEWNQVITWDITSAGQNTLRCKECEQVKSVRSRKKDRGNE